MSSGQVYLTDPDKIQLVRELLFRERHPVLVDFAAQATRYPLLIVPDDAVHSIGFTKSYGGGDRGQGYFYVTVMEFSDRGAYPLLLGSNLHAGYVREKLGLKTVACANNVTAFLNAIGSDDVTAFLKTVPLSGDHVDHYRVQAGSGFLHAAE